MIKKVLISVFVISSLFMAKPVMAQEAENCVQVTQYGGAVGIVCGAKHEPVDTGLADMNPVVLAGIFFGLAGASLVKSKKLVRAQVAL
ncbi:hypothetical protein ISR94_02460 [Candidatus Microgenomates bacterium]|nr:hypothetical protein [Candidatus Microgenomates bacterium]